MLNSGTRLRNIRTKLNYTQKDFGQKIGYKWNKIKDIENNRLKLTPEIAEKIEEIFGINGWWLLTGKGEMFISDKKEENLEVKGKVVNREGKLLFRFVTEEDIQEVCNLMEYAPPAIVKQIKKKLLEIKKISES